MKPFQRKRRNDAMTRLIAYDVHGFWSGANVRVGQAKDWTTKEWKTPKINWSCGGRDPEKEPDGIVAVECFGKAIADAVKVARKWQKDCKELNKERKP